MKQLLYQFKKLPITTRLSLFIYAMLLLTTIIIINNSLTKQETRTHAANTVTASTCTKFVAKNGNDANPGTEASPWQTIQKAANVAVAGDTVCVKSGTYDEQVIFPNSGNSNGWITFQNFGTDEVTITAPNGNYPCNAGRGDGCQGNFQIIEKSYIAIQGFKFIGGDNVNLEPASAIAVFQNAHDIRIIGNSFFNTGSHEALRIGYYGISTYSAWNIDVLDNYATDNRPFDHPYSGEEFSFDHVNNVNISNNTIDGYTGGIGIDVKEGSANIIIGYNKISNVTWEDSTGGNDWTGNLGAAIYVDGYSKGVENASVFNNTSTGSDFIGVGSECGGLVKNISFYNNIIVGGHQGYSVPSYCGSGCTCSGIKYQNISFINNVAYNASNGGFWFRIQVGQPDIIVRNNIGYGSGSNSIASGVTQSNNLFSIDPKFINPSNYDFHLQLDSLAIDAGTSNGAPNFDFDGNARPVGAAYDIGAYEWCTGPGCITVPTLLLNPSNPPLSTPTPTMPYVTPTMYCLGLNACATLPAATQAPTITSTPDVAPPQTPGNNPSVIGGALLLIPFAFFITIYYLLTQRKPKK